MRGDNAHNSRTDAMRRETIVLRKGSCLCKIGGLIITVPFSFQLSNLEIPHQGVQMEGDGFSHAIRLLK